MDIVANIVIYAEDWIMLVVENSDGPKVAKTRVGAPVPSCNLKTMLWIMYPFAGNLSIFATCSTPHFPAGSRI